MELVLPLSTSVHLGNVLAVLRGHGAIATKAVLEGDTDIMTPHDVRFASGHVCAAMLSQLQTWGRHVCSARHPSRCAVNAMGTRCVLRWKLVRAASGAKTCEVRAQLRIRGVKDMHGQGFPGRRSDRTLGRAEPPRF